MKKVHFVLGRVANQRTEICYQEIKDKLNEKNHKPLILLVPEQANLQTQRNLSEFLGEGLLDASVKSFNTTLLRDVFNEVGESDVTIIDDLERMIILKRIVEEHQKELIFYKKNYRNIGFLESTNAFLSILEQAGINDEDLSDIRQHPQTSMLFKSKIADIQLIYRVFKEYLSTHFITTEERLILLAQAILKSKKLEKAQIWLDGYYGFTHPQLQIIESLIEKAESLTITLPMDRTYQKDEKVLPSNLFFESIINMQRIMALCDKHNVTYTTEYQESPEDKKIPVYLKTYRSRAEEVEAVARQISYLVREEGYRYRDFAVIVSDLSLYQTYLESTFHLNEFPYFLDAPYPVRGNPLIAVIEAILEVVSTNYSYKSMMALLRTQMLPNVTRHEIDLIENELITYQIKGKKRWHSEWTYIKDEQQKEIINQAREKIVRPIKAFEKKLRKKDVKHITEALYYFLEDIDAYTTLQNKVVGENRLLELEYTQIWRKVMEVFERLVAILDEDKMSLTVYKRILITSFSYIKMGIIPPTLDQITIGEIERMRLQDVKVCFILGANEGLMPKVNEKTQMFSDADKILIQEACESDSGAKWRLSDLLIRQPIYGDRFLVHTVLTKARDKCYLFAATADENGALLRPSSVYFDLKREYGEMQEPNELDMIERPLATLNHIGHQIREYVEGRGKEGLWQDALSYYKTHEPWSQQIDTFVTYLEYTNQQHYLQPSTAKMLYGNKLKTSISKLEEFRKCPCCYFIKYGIKAKERKYFINYAQVGTLFHSALERYPQELMLINKDWKNATPEESKHCVRQSVQYAIDKVSTTQKDNGRFKFMASKIERMTQRAVRALTEHLKNSEFVPEGYEVKFGEGQLFPPIHLIINDTQSIDIYGTIDRIDIYHQDAGDYVKILDYKSGKTKFDLGEVYYGFQLQLLLYLDAYLEKNPNQIEAGVFYFHINTSYADYKAKEDALKADLKQFKLSGLVLDQTEIIRALDEDVTSLPVTLKKDNTPKKTSSIASLEQFEKLREYVLELVKNLGKEILKGKISIRPCIIGNKNPCNYCAYKGICQFDEKLPDNEIEEINKEVNVWKELGVENKN